MYGDPIACFARAIAQAEQLTNAHSGEYEIHAFVQTFSDTTLGRGGIGGQAISSALRTVIVHGSSALVFTGSMLDYWIWFESGNDDWRKFREDLSSFQLPERRGWRKAYPNALPMQPKAT